MKPYAKSMLERSGTCWLANAGPAVAARLGTLMTEKDIIKPGPLMAGKRGLVMGVANERSIAWGIARALAQHGAKLAFTYQGDAFGRRAFG